jgi:lysozyme
MNIAIDIATRTIKAHEGLRLHPYKCTSGKITIGYGRNLDDVGISQSDADHFLKEDIKKAHKAAKTLFDSFNELNPRRQAVLIDMAFNLGMTRLSKFKKMIEAVNYHDYEKAAHEMLDSKWAVQVGNRANYLAEAMREGTY